MLQREAAKAFGVLVLEALVTLSRREVLREVLWRSFWKNMWKWQLRKFHATRMLISYSLPVKGCPKQFELSIQVCRGGCAGASIPQSS